MGDPDTPHPERASLDDSLLKKLEVLAKGPDNRPSIEDFTIIKPISRGAFGKVFLGCKNTNTTQLYAIKVMRKLDMVNKNMVSQVITERNALLLSRSDFCVSLLYSLETTSYIYLVMDYMVGGDLKSLLTMYGFFEEHIAKFYAAEVGCALEFLHDQGIVHRDIKPDNMLIAGTGHIKLTDFGLSQLNDHCQAELAAMNRETKASKYLDARTPGQVFSLTSQFYFGSHHRADFSTFRERMERSPLNESSEGLHDDSKMSGVTPFYSADESFSVKTTVSEEYYTCNSSTGSRKSLGSPAEAPLIRKSFLNCRIQKCIQKENQHGEDSGVSSNNKTNESSDKSSKIESDGSYAASECTDTPVRSFKRPPCKRGRRQMESAENSGLTLEIDALELGTPKKKAKNDEDTPLKSVLKVRTLADNETVPSKNPHLGNVMASTPVSSQKKYNRIPKATRFDIPKSNSELMSPIVKHTPSQDPSSNERTPRTFAYTQKRTPKSVRRGGGIQSPSDERILGTPDYLAPELLKMEGHGPAVDWWALGVCLYEFLTGFPPFNDETPERVFQNILSRNIEWPVEDEALSDAAMDAVEYLLTMDPNERPAAKEMHQMVFFKDLEWKDISQMEPPFIPTVTDPHDTGYFEPRNALQHLKLSQFDFDI